MTHVRRILVPVDFSRTSAAALRAATRIAARIHARIHLLHVLPVPHGPVQTLRALRELRAEAGHGSDRVASGKERDTLAAWAERVGKECGKVSTWLAMGKPGEEIVLAADQLKADLIVMGTRGLNGFRGVLLGSTAAETVRSAGVPVLTIGGGATFDPRCVLVADDLGPGGLAAIEAAGSMFDPATARVLLLHVIDPGPFVYTGVSEWGWAPTPSIPPGDGKRVLADLEKRSARLGKKGFEVECLVDEGSAAATIAAVARKRKARTLVLATHQRTALARLMIGSTAEALIRRSPCPVLTVKPILRAVRVGKGPLDLAAAAQAGGAPSPREGRRDRNGPSGLGIKASAGPR
jgi:nucleotide-binding universal stress UspA family protein